MRQDIKAATRQVLFQTELEDYPYSCGGSLFVVDFGGRCYGVTCKHVIRNETLIFVAPSHILAIGMKPAGIEKVVWMNDPKSDLQDIAIICFSAEIGPVFFGGTAYIIDPSTVGPSETADELRVYGFLNTKTIIDYEAKRIIAGYCDLQFRNVGATSSDPFIRQALATYAGHGFNSLDGISGAPVFDETRGWLCGMAVRGGLNELGHATLWYVDIFYIVKLLEAVHAGSSKVYHLIYPSHF